MSGPSALFRFDASVAIGAGHAGRCLALADHLAGAGWRATLAIDAATAEAAPQLARSNHRRVIVDAADTPAALAAGGPYDLLVVDHYGRADGWERACRAFCRSVLAFDDLADRPHDANWLVDPADPARAARYRPLVPAHCSLLLGPDYAPLRPQFSAARTSARDPSRAGREDLRRILVAPGATDPTDLASAALDAIASSGVDAEVDVMLSSRAPHLATVRSHAARLGSIITVHVDVEEVAALMAGADLAIGAPGSSAWERCAVGLPSIVMVAAENQRATASMLATAGAALVVDRPSDLPAVLRALARDPARRAALADAGRLLCDGRGLDRLLLALLAPAWARDGAPVTLRLAGPADADLLLDWQRDPETRRHSPDPMPPDPASHRRWVAARHADPQCLMTIATCGGRPVGALRLDRDQPRPGAATVSIYAAPGAYRRGYGRAMLDLAHRALPGFDLVARVLPTNIASLALFRTAGYRSIGDDHHLLDGATAKPTPDIG